MRRAVIILTRLTLLVGLLALAAPGELCGQEVQSERVQVGDRVRVRAPSLYSGPLVGEVAALRADTLVLAVKRTRMIPLPLASITRLEKSRGRRGLGVKGALVGGVVGGALAAAFLRSGGGPAADLVIPVGAFCRVRRRRTHYGAG